MEDAAIVTLFWERSESAILEAETRYGPYCTAVAGRILNDAEDTRECLNDLWFAAWQSIPPKRPENLKSYLGKLARNLAVSRWREGCRLKRGGGELPLVLEELGDCVSGGQDPAEALAARELSDALNRWLAGLSTRERRLFVDRYFFVCTVPELSDKYGMSRAHVNTVLFRTRRKLKDYLEKEGLI